MLWLPIIILSYLFFSLASLGDKLILKGGAKPKLYAFYVGIFGGLIVVLIPFIKFNLPDSAVLVWIILEAVAFIFGVYTMFLALEKFDASKVIPVIGAVQPILILIFTLVIFGSEVMNEKNILAFLVLLLASIIISVEKKPQITMNFLKLTMISALMFSLDYIFSKIVFLNIPFLEGLIWTRIFIFLFVLTFLFSRNFRKQAFKKQVVLNKKTGALFLLTQTAGGLAIFLQSFAISLAPIAYLAIVNSLRGIQYVFLFLATTFLSYFYPKVLKEKISRKLVAQKIISIALIVLGLVILAIY